MASYYASFGSWNRTYHSLQGAMTAPSCGCCSGNCQQDLTGVVGSFLQDSPCGFTSTGQAVQFLADELKRRLGAVSILVQSGSATAYVLNIRLSYLSGDTATVRLQLTSGGNYPVGVRWSRAKRFSTGLSSCSSKDSLLEYLTWQLKR